MSADSDRPAGGRRAVWLVVALGVAVVVGLLLVRAVANMREAARFTQCRNNLKQIELALHNYHDVYGMFPPAVTYGPDGRPWHSWRVLIFPYLEASPFYSRYRMDEPWDGPNNRKLREQYDGYWKSFAWVLHCPSDESDGRQTSYLAVIGRDTMWPADGTASFKDATDGAGNVIHVVEVSGSGVHWMEPKDLRLDAMTFRVSGSGEDIRSRHVEAGWLREGAARANAAFVDGTVRAIGGDASAEEVKSLLVRDDGVREGAP